MHQCAEFANLPSEYLEMSLNINLYFKKWSSVQVSNANIDFEQQKNQQ
jgi:hypothetical protein